MPEETIPSGGSALGGGGGHRRDWQHVGIVLGALPEQIELRRNGFSPCLMSGEGCVASVAMFEIEERLKDLLGTTYSWSVAPKGSQVEAGSLIV